MSDQHLVESFIDKGARPTAANRFTSKNALLGALCSAVIAGAVLHYALPPEEAGDELVDLAPAYHETAPMSPAVAAPFNARPVARRGPSLSREQQNVARFIASRYELAIDQTQQFVEFAYRSAREAKLDPWLILAVISVESAFDPSAQSTRGAQGLMQVLTRVHADKFAPFGGATAAFDPLANIRVGVQILKGYIARDGSVEAALKAYVGAAAKQHDSGYGEKVLTERERIAAAASGAKTVAKAIARPGKADGDAVPWASRSSRTGGANRGNIQDRPYALPDSPIRETIDVDHHRDRAGLGAPLKDTGG